MTRCVPPPDQTVWWDNAAVTASALERLRLTDTDPDAARIAGLVDVAGEMINDYLDRRCPPAVVTAAMTNAVVALTVELYAQRDIPVMGAGGGTRIERVDTDIDETRIEAILTAIAPKKSRLGLA